MDNREITTWQDEAALYRFQLIAPLLGQGLDKAKKIQLRKDIAAVNAVSEKSLRRYEAAYRSHGYAGLKPQVREKHRIQSLPVNFEELLEQAIQLKREVPSRSVHQIIYVLENEGRVPPGVLKRSTLQRHLYNAGFGQKQMRKYTEGLKSSSKRFCKPHRMMLLQADIMYGPMLPIGKNGKKVQTYLTSILDDHSRFVLESAFYDNQEKTIVEETFRKAILRYGTFDAAYCDNGKQYVSGQLVRSCSKLGIHIYHAKPYSGQSKGKIERFHQVVDDFVAEARAKKITTLEDLNRYWTYEKTDEATRIIDYKDVDENNSKRKSYQQLMDMGENNYTQENYDKYCDWWGVYFLQTTSKDPAPMVYSDYKGRWSIETYNNYVKNDADFNDLKIQDYYVQHGFDFIMLVTGIIHEKLNEAVKRINKYLNS